MEKLTVSGDGDPVIVLALDTIQKNKQALLFANSKRSAEKTAEDIARKIKETNACLESVSDKALNSLGKPTKQCERLAKVLKKGIAFHHAGLHRNQKELIESEFRQGNVKIICCTPTLAAGVDLPAFRSIIKSVKRYSSGFGMDFIPVLEYLQMAGRAGRPKFDSYGEAVVFASGEDEADELFERYVAGLPEELYSKLAVEPVLRTYVLSLVSTRIATTEKSLFDFFSRTFWAYQFRDDKTIQNIIRKMLQLLSDWEFLHEVEQGHFRATFLGQRVAQLYLDPLTAHKMLLSLKKMSKTPKAFSFLQVICNLRELRPLLRVKSKEYDELQSEIGKWLPHIIVNEPSMFESEYEDWLSAFKTTLMLQDWIDENDEQFLLEKYDSRPGETRSKLELADWLLYAMSELAKILQLQQLLKEISKTRFRLKYGIKEELLPLVRLKGIGRVRARMLFSKGIKDLGDVKKSDLVLLSKIIGPSLAKSVKEQLGEKVNQPYFFQPNQ